MIRASERPAWLRRDLITDSQRRSSGLSTHLEKLVAGGETIHGAAGDTVAYLLSELEARKISYTLEADPGRGYKISTVRNSHG